jgi:molecular chaperone DnaJ
VYDATGSPDANFNKSGPFRRGKPFTSVFDDFFDNFMNKRANGGAGEHIQLIAEVTLEQVHSGDEIELPYERHTICPTCVGAGGAEEMCEHCKGSGLRVIVGEAHTVQTTCPACNGQGSRVTKSCEDCGGSGYSEAKEEKFKFKIPPGSETGMRFVHHGKGEPSSEPGREAGESLRRGTGERTRVVQEDAERKRHDRLAGWLHPACLRRQRGSADNQWQKITFTIPPGTQPGTKFRLSGVGLPIFNNGGSTYQWGDQLVQVKMEVPTQVDDKYKSALRELAELEKVNLTPQRKRFLDQIRG